MQKASRGEVWDADLNPTRGHEQAGTRPVLVLSVDELNKGPAELAIVIPISTKDKKVRSQVAVHPPEGGLTELSFVKCEAIRSVSTLRLIRRRGNVSADTIAKVEFCVRVLLGL